VREILVGAPNRELARRLGRLEAQLAAQAEELRSEARRRLDVLEAHVRKEVEVLSASTMAQEAAQRDALGALQQRVQKLEERMGRVQYDFRAELLTQAKSFIDEVERTRAELTQAIERELVAGGEPGEARGEPAETRPAPAAEPAAQAHGPWEPRSEAA
jgi:hypothetical protein